MQKNQLSVADCLQQQNERLSKIENLLIGTKTVLNFDELAAYSGLSKSYLYKLSSAGLIPMYKPTGKVCFFNKKEIDIFLQRNPVKTSAQLETDAATIVTLEKKGGAK